MSSDEYGWLIELRGSRPQWLENVYLDETWTYDAAKALRFARKQDAEHVINEIGWTEAFASEHVWCAVPDRKSSALDYVRRAPKSTPLGQAMRPDGKRG